MSDHFNANAALIQSFCRAHYADLNPAAVEEKLMQAAKNKKPFVIYFFTFNKESKYLPLPDRVDDPEEVAHVIYLAYRLGKRKGDNSISLDSCINRNIWQDKGSEDTAGREAERQAALADSLLMNTEKQETATHMLVMPILPLIYCSD